MYGAWIRIKGTMHVFSYYNFVMLIHLAMTEADRALLLLPIAISFLFLFLTSTVCEL